MYRKLAVVMVVGAFGVGWLGMLPAVAAASVDVHVFNGQGTVVARGDSAGAAMEFYVDGPAPDTTMTVTLPTAPATALKAVRAGNLPGSPVVPCTNGSPANTYTCHTGALDNQSYRVEFTVAATAPIGSTGVISVRVDPVPGPDANPSDNTGSATFTVAGHPILHNSVSPLPARVPLGGQAILHAVISNSGPDAATDLGAALYLYSQPSRLHYGTFRSSTVTVYGAQQSATWRIGTLAAGKQATLDIPIRNTGAITAGQLTFYMDYYGRNADVPTTNQTRYPITTTTPVPPPTNPGGPILAVTGTRVWAPFGVGVIAIATGLALCAAARPRRARANQLNH